MSYDTNVFINCPFDDDYMPLLKPMLFTIKKLGFKPRISLERSDSAEVRLEKIKELIENSKFGIHDLSRARARIIGEYFRLNMPFELGIDLGCRIYNENLNDKKILILEEEKYSVQKSLSDMSFADCKCHKGDAEHLITQLRNWFAENGHIDLPSASSLWDDYNEFLFELYIKKKAERFKDKEIDKLPISELMAYMDGKLSKIVA